jgi:hypothetical protein
VSTEKFFVTNKKRFASRARPANTDRTHTHTHTQPTKPNAHKEEMASTPLPDHVARYQCVGCRHLFPTIWLTDPCEHVLCVPCATGLAPKASASASVSTGTAITTELTSSSASAPSSISRASAGPIRCPACATQLASTPVRESLWLTREVANLQFQCAACGLGSIRASDLADHRRLLCPEALLACPNKCEDGPVARSKMLAHQLECAAEIVPCPVREFGCAREVARSNVDAHMDADAGNHMRLMAQATSKLAAQVASLHSELVRERAERGDEKKTGAPKVAETKVATYDTNIGTGTGGGGKGSSSTPPSSVASVSLATPSRSVSTKPVVSDGELSAETPVGREWSAVDRWARMERVMATVHDLSPPPPPPSLASSISATPRLGAPKESGPYALVADQYNDWYVAAIRACKAPGAIKISFLNHSSDCDEYVTKWSGRVRPVYETLAAHYLFLDTLVPKQTVDLRESGTGVWHSAMVRSVAADLVVFMVFTADTAREIGVSRVLLSSRCLPVGAVTRLEPYSSATYPDRDVELRTSTSSK